MTRARMIADGVVRFSVPFNAMPWFSQATEDELKSLEVNAWQWNCEDSAVVAYAAALHDDRLSRVLSALARSGRDIPFTCEFDEASAKAWMRRYRPKWVDDEEAQEKVRLPLRRYLSKW